MANALKTHEQAAQSDLAASQRVLTAAEQRPGRRARYRPDLAQVVSVLAELRTDRQRSDWSLAVDFGTTFTVGAVAEDGRVTLVYPEGNGNTRDSLGGVAG